MHTTQGRDESRAALDENSGNLLARFQKLDQHGDELDCEPLAALRAELLDKFVESPEAEPLAHVGTCDLVMEYASDYFDATIATLQPDDLEEIVFEILPRKYSVEPSEAGAIVEELRAFYAFLGRELRLAHAESCLAVLGGDAARELEAELANPDNYGMAKSFFMRGSAAGFDTSAPEGIEAWVQASNTRLLSVARSPSAIASGPAVDPAVARARRNRRKAQRKARKRNR